MQVDLADAQKILSSYHISLVKDMTKDMLSSIVEAAVNEDVVQSEKQLALYIIIAEIE